MARQPRRKTTRLEFDGIDPFKGADQRWVLRWRSPGETFARTSTL
jgi:hypothetical protein